jgi:hypothetical protein
MELGLRAGGDGDVVAARDLLAGILEACTENSVVAQDLDGGILVWNDAVLAHGFDGYISKPIAPDQLEGELLQFLASSNSATGTDGR